jgi:4-hydroxybenzoate polyprenyltransferase
MAESTRNDLRDVNSDREHPRKKNRPIAAGQVSPAAGRVFSVFSSAPVLRASCCYSAEPCFLYASRCLNSICSIPSLRETFPYLDIAVNTATHPLRFLLGALLVGRDAPLLHLGAYFFFVFGLSCLRREFEKDVEGWEARPTLKAYSLRTLRWLELASMAFIFGFLAVDCLVSRFFYTTIIAIYLLLAVGARVSPVIRSYLHYVWTR